MRRQSGASNTEYILIVVMIALAAMFMVKGLGVELRTLFSRSTRALNLFENKAPEDGTGNLNEPNPGPAPAPTPTPSPPPEPNHDAECQQQWAALQQERETVGAPLAQARQEAQRHYHEAMRRERYWVGGHHSHWGAWGSSGHWAYRYVHSDSERAAARDQLHRAQTAYDNWNRDWRQRYHQWQSDCGH